MKYLKSTAQTRYDLRYHFVWIPRYRKRVLRGELGKRLEGMIRYCCQIHDWEVFEIAVEEDHIHLYMGAQPKYSPSKIMKLIKGGTSKKIREQYPELDEVYWGTTFWGDGYMVKSSGKVSDKVISRYIRNQT